MKPDTQLMHKAPGPATAHTINAVLAEAERAGGTVLAEGLETPAHLDLAVSAGATLGQGWLFEKPTGQLPPASTHLPPAAHDTHVPATDEADGSSTTC